MESIENRKVFHLVDHMGLGGAQRLIQGLVSNGYGDEILALRSKGKLIGKIPENIKISFGNFSLFFLITFLRIHKEIQETKANYVHCHLLFSFIAGIILSYFNSSVKFVFHEHGGLADGNWLVRQILKFAASRGKIIVNSNKQLSLCQNTGISDQVVLIRNFINQSEFFVDKEAGQRFREDLGIGRKMKLVGFAARLIPSKGWQDLVKAFHLLSREDVILLIAGEGKDFGKIQKIIESNNISNSILLGQIVNMRGFYNALDIFILPSKREAFGLAHIEAQACGIPIIVNDISGLNETVDKSNSILVEPGNVDQLKASIKKLLDSQLTAAELSSAGLLNSERFTPERFILRLINET